MSDPAVLETVEQVEVAPPTEGNQGMADAFAMMRDALRDTTPHAPAEPAGEPDAPVEAAPDEAPTEPAPTAAPPSRRAKTVEKVKTEAEQRIADAEARAAAAEARAAEIEAKAQEQAQAATTAQERDRVAALEAEYGEWIGTPAQYAEAQRLSRMDPDAEGWDWERHKAAVNNLDTWDARRKWAGTLTDAAKLGGRAEAHQDIAKDFLVTLAEDLPEDKREAYRSHKDGIPGAVRFYAEQIAAPKIEALESKLAERDAEIERLRAGGRYGRSPAPGGVGGGGSAPAIDYERASPEELMAAELRAQAHANGRRR